MGNPLEMLSQCLEFEMFREKLESVLTKEDRRSNAGRRPIDPVFDDKGHVHTKNVLPK